MTSRLRIMLEIGMEIVNYARHKCAVCGLKVDRGEKYYVAVTSFRMIHSYHLDSSQNVIMGGIDAVFR